MICDSGRLASVFHFFGAGATEGSDWKRSGCVDEDDRENRELYPFLAKQDDGKKISDWVLERVRVVMWGRSPKMNWGDNIIGLFNSYVQVVQSIEVDQFIIAAKTQRLSLTWVRKGERNMRLVKLKENGLNKGPKGLGFTKILVLHLQRNLADKGFLLTILGRPTLL